MTSPPPDRVATINLGGYVIVWANPVVRQPRYRIVDQKPEPQPPAAQQAPTE